MTGPSREAVQRAVQQLQAELTAAAPAIGAILSEDDLASAGYEPVRTIAQRLAAVLNELDDLIECAEDIGWHGVQHKVEAAVGDLRSALTAARQYEEGRKAAE